MSSFMLSLLLTTTAMMTLADADSENQKTLLSPEMNYYIKNRNSGMYISTVYGRYGDPRLWLWQTAKPTRAIKFRFEKIAGHHELYNVHMAADHFRGWGTSTFPGYPGQYAECVDMRTSEARQFHVESADAGALRVLESNTELALHVENDSKQEGAWIDFVEPQMNSPGQTWDITPAF